MELLIETQPLVNVGRTFMQMATRHVVETGGRVPVIFILSPGHSGSTLLDLLIGKHSEAISGGEFRTGVGRRAVVCTCRRKPSDCTFWSRVLEQLRPQGFDLDDIEAYETDKQRRFAIYNHALLGAMQRVGQVRHIVDSSKRSRRLRLYLRHPDLFDVRIVLLSRNPLGTTYSYWKRGSGLISTGMKVFLHYLLQLRYARQAATYVSYEALSADPEGELRHAMRDIGMAFEPAQLHLDDQAEPAHNLGGNPMRKKPITEIRTDTSWKTGFERPVRLAAKLSCLPAFGALQVQRAARSLPWINGGLRG